MAAFWDYRLAGRGMHDPRRMEVALRAVALLLPYSAGSQLLTHLHTDKRAVLPEQFSGCVPELDREDAAAYDRSGDSPGAEGAEDGGAEKRDAGADA